jgi:methionine-rich copper-binding protein CopC
LMNEITNLIRYERSAVGRSAWAPPTFRERGFKLLLVALIAWSHAATAGTLHVRESVPTADAIIHGRHAEYVIRFDGPVDHIASRMEIMQSGRVVQSLTPLGDSAVDVLFASGEAPAPGRYVLRWQARSVADGTVSDGSIPFSVEP